MRLMSVPFFSWLPSMGRILTLAVAVVLCMIVSPGGAAAQSGDDHGNIFNTATNLSLGTSITARIDPGDDRDVFKLDLSAASGQTDVWLYTTGELDTVGEFYDVYGALLVSNDDRYTTGRNYNFQIRRNVPPGVYYLLVRTYYDETGEYTLHTRAVTEPGNAPDAATRLMLDSPRPGIIDETGGADYFRLDLTESTNLRIYGRSWNYVPVEATVFDSTGETEVPVNIYPQRIRVFGFIFRDGFRIWDDLGPGTYYIKVSSPARDIFRDVPYTIIALDDPEYTEFIDTCEARTRSLNNPQIKDSLYGCQWHLENRNEVDINIEDVWAEGIMGEGVNIAIVDEGIDYTHPDLNENFDVTLSHDYTGSGDIYHPFEHHGTHLAGALAARDNDFGVRGVAPRATIYGYNLLAASESIFNETDAMIRNRAITAASNNSWGPSDGPRLGHASSFWERAVNEGLRTGYHGKGTFYVFAGGNGHLNGDNSNLDEYANYFGVTAVCAVNDHDTRSDYSETGANLWVCAPSNDSRDEHRGIVTTENSDRYLDDSGGTSTAAPQVTGVAALMRSVNPDLTWRDLKLILAATARKNDVRNPGWEDGAHIYGSATERYHFNHDYGFGVLDAKAAVDLANGWNNIPALGSSTAASGPLEAQIPDAPNDDDPVTVVSALAIDTNIGFTEFVEVRATFLHRSFRDLEIELVSPSGTVSKLVDEFDTYSNNFGLVRLNGGFRFGSARHLGEDPNGEWQLRITDRLPYVDGILDSWSITVYGHERTPGPPTVDSVTAVGESLTLAWTAPAQTAGLVVSSYDLRHILSDADETMDSNWTVVDDVWTAAAGGDLEFAIDGLVPRERHDVQVRATNDWGDGDWSAAITGTPGNARPSFTEGSATNRSIPENSPAGSDVGDPVAATDADGDTMIYTLGGNDADSFDIDAVTGQITVGAGTTLDYETLTSQSGDVVSTDVFAVDVTATDIFDVTDSITVTIMVTNVDLPGKGNDYDADSNEIIDREEAIAAVIDYFDGILTKEETLQIIQLYFSS